MLTPEQQRIADKFYLALAHGQDAFGRVLLRMNRTTHDAIGRAISDGATVTNVNSLPDVWVLVEADMPDMQMSMEAF